MSSYVITRLLLDANAPWLVYEFCTFLPYALQIEILYYVQKMKMYIYPRDVSFVHRRYQED